MATKKESKEIGSKAPATKAVRVQADTTPKFPYTTKPGSLRRLLKEIPRKPRPPKFDGQLLRSWGFADQNDMSLIRVLKSVNLLNEKSEPTDRYAQFMNLDGGGRILGPEIRRVYEPLFQASHTPYTESNEKLKNLFNIHSGGGDRTLDHQIQTFKALSENASFDLPANTGAVEGIPAQNGSPIGPKFNEAGIGAAININLHIHLPENKGRRDYENIIEDIGRFIFGRPVRGE